MKERKNTQSTKSSEYPIKEGIYSYKSLFVGLNKKGGLYVGLNKAKSEDKDFVGGFEAIALLNSILNEFDTVSIQYGKEVSKSGNPYETAACVDYKI